MSSELELVIFRSEEYGVMVVEVKEEQLETSLDQDLRDPRIPRLI